MNLSTHGKTTRCINGVAAGQATTNGTAVDMKDFRAVTFYAAIGAITSTGTVTLKAQQSSDNGVADSFSDIEGSAIVFDDAADNKLAVLEIVCPQKRYVRPVIITATADGVIDGCIAVQTSAHAEPVTHGATVLQAALLHAPAEGTA